MNISQKIREDARSFGLCDEHYNAWNPKWSISELADYLLSNPNWCMKEHFPTFEMFKKYGDSDEVRAKGVFVDASVTFRAKLSTYIFIRCFVGLIVSHVCTLYFRDGGKGKVVVEDGGVCMINIYDSAEVEVETRGTGKAMVNMFGDVTPALNGKNIKLKRR